MPATLQEWFFALLLLLFGIFLIWICLWLWGSIIKWVWQERSTISNFFKTNPIGEWILRLSFAIPVFWLITMALNSDYRSVGNLIFYGLWFIFASLMYFVWL